MQNGHPASELLLLKQNVGNAQVCTGPEGLHNQLTELACLQGSGIAGL